MSSNEFQKLLQSASEECVFDEILEYLAEDPRNPGVYLGAIERSAKAMSQALWMWSAHKKDVSARMGILTAITEASAQLLRECTTTPPDADEAQRLGAGRKMTTRGG